MKRIALATMLAVLALGKFSAATHWRPLVAEQGTDKGTDSDDDSGDDSSDYDDAT